MWVEAGGTGGLQLSFNITGGQWDDHQLSIDPHYIEPIGPMKHIVLSVTVTYCLGTYLRITRGEAPW